MSINQNFPEVSPSLTLDFANSKTLDPRITFTRSSTGTYVGADGLIKIAGVDEPRFDHDPTTGESLGLLIEEQRTNLLSYSQDFTSAFWTKSQITVSSNVVVAPDGILTADKLVEDSTLNTHSINQLTATLDPSPGGNYYTFSVYVKPAGRNHIRIQMQVSSNATQWEFNLLDYSVSNTYSAWIGHNAVCTPIGNGWVRCVLYGQAPSIGGTAIRAVIQLSDGTTNSYQGDGTSGVYIWGAQLELGSFPTSYIPTTASQVTRLADNASITGTNLSSWFNSTEGTIFSDVSYANGTFAWILHNGSNDNRYGHNSAPSGVNAGVPFAAISGVSYQFQDPGPTVIAGSGKLSYGYRANDYGIYGDGIKINTTSPPSVVSGINEFAIGFRGSYDPSSYLNGCLNRFTYYPKRLTDSQLQNLTK